MFSGEGWEVFEGGEVGWWWWGGGCSSSLPVSSGGGEQFASAAVSKPIFKTI